METPAPKTAPPARPPYRPPIGIPIQDNERWKGVIGSVAIHLLLLVIILGGPVLASQAFVDPGEEAFAGEGPAGGGGGGTRGTGGSRISAPDERIRFIQLAPPVQKEPEPEPEPEVPPPVVIPEVKPPEPPPVQLQDTRVDTTPTIPDAARVLGVGGGAGNDGTTGSGPGSGGGIGSGVGTGTGSGRGPGTGGGGTSSIYPPTAIQVGLPPMNPPARIRPYKVVAVFDVDSTGKVLSFDFNRSRDNGYNRKLEAMLAEIRFRPAVTADGRPVRHQARIEFEVF